MAKATLMTFSAAALVSALLVSACISQVQGFDITIDCGNLKDCGTCSEFTPTCRWCFSGYDIPTCESQTNPNSPCKAWVPYSDGDIETVAPLECPAFGRRLKQAFSGDGPM